MTTHIHHHTIHITTQTNANFHHSSHERKHRHCSLCVTFQIITLQHTNTQHSTQQQNSSQRTTSSSEKWNHRNQQQQHSDITHLELYNPTEQGNKLHHQQPITQMIKPEQIAATTSQQKHQGKQIQNKMLLDLVVVTKFSLSLHGT